MPVCAECGASKARERFVGDGVKESSFCLSCFSLANNAPNTYARLRESLEDLGYADYAAYLDSDLWHSIRSKFLPSGDGKCPVCRDGKATQVHHTNYSLPVMKGERNDKLMPICRRCHAAAEFKGGKKVSLNEANSRIAAAKKAGRKSLVDRPRVPGLSPKKRRRKEKKRAKLAERESSRAVFLEAVAVLDAMREYAMWNHLPNELVERAEVVIASV